MSDTAIAEAAPSVEVQPETPVNEVAVPQEAKSEDAPQTEVPETLEQVKAREEKAQKKIERQKAANRDQQRLIRDMQKRIADYEAKSKPDDGRPKAEDYDDPADFAKAEGKWEAKQEFEAQTRKASEPSPEETHKQMLEHAQKQVAFSQAQETYAAQNPAYNKNAEVVNKFLAMANPQSEGFKVFGEYALDTSNKGLELIDHLGANPQKCLELFTMQPDELRDALEDIRDSLGAPAKSKVDLPEPTSPIRGNSARPSKSMDDMTGRELLDRVYGRKKP